MDNIAGMYIDGQYKYITEVADAIVTMMNTLDAGDQIAKNAAESSKVWYRDTFALSKLISAGYTTSVADKTADLMGDLWSDLTKAREALQRRNKKVSEENAEQMLYESLQTQAHINANGGSPMYPKALFAKLGIPDNANSIVKYYAFYLDVYRIALSISALDRTDESLRLWEIKLLWTDQDKSRHLISDDSYLNIADFLHAFNKIAAIKEYRTATGKSLEESKDVIDVMAPIIAPDKYAKR